MKLLKTRSFRARASKAKTSHQDMPTANSIKKSRSVIAPVDDPVTHSKPINSTLSSITHVANRTLIDEVALSLPVDGELPGDTVNLVSEDGEIKWRGQNRREINGRVLPGCTARVRTVNRTNLKVVSSIKFLHGHNVAGSENLKTVVKAVLDRVISQVKYHYDLVWTLPKPAGIKLEEVALVRHVRCPSGVEPPQLIDALQRRGALNGVTGIHHVPGETYTCSTYKREYSVSFYWKEREMEATTGRDTVHSKYDLLRDHVAGCVRVEVRVRAGLLKKLGLDYIVNWKRATADQVVSSMLDRLHFLWVQPFGLRQQAALSGLPKALGRVVALAQAGEDLKKHFAPSSISRFRRQAREFRIDLMASGGTPEAIQFDFSTCEWVTSAAEELRDTSGFAHFFK